MRSWLLRCTLTVYFLAAAGPYVHPQTSDSASAQPISAEQLSVLLEEEQIGDAETSLIHEQLENKRATFPKWFPNAVWDDVERKVEAIHFADVALPTYQKYMTSDQADALILLYKGAAGQAIASTLAQRAATSAKAGYTGYANDQQVASTVKGDADVQALFRKRLSELSPEQRTHLQGILPVVGAAMPRIEDESDAAYNLKVNEVVQQVLALHKTDIAKAQRTATPSQH